MQTTVIETDTTAQDCGAAVRHLLAEMDGLEDFDLPERVRSREALVPVGDSLTSLGIDVNEEWDLLTLGEFLSHLLNARAIGEPSPVVSSLTISRSRPIAIIELLTPDDGVAGIFYVDAKTARICGSDFEDTIRGFETWVTVDGKTLDSYSSRLTKLEKNNGRR